MTLDHQIQDFLYQLQVRTIVHACECDEVLNKRLKALQATTDRHMFLLEASTPFINEIKLKNKKDALRRLAIAAYQSNVALVAFCNSLNKACIK